MERIKPYAGRPSDLERSMHFQDTTGSWECDVCGEKFGKNVSVRQHVVIHFNMEELKFRIRFNSLQGEQCRLNGRAGKMSRGMMSTSDFDFRIIEVIHEVDPCFVKTKLRDYLSPQENLIILIPESILATMPPKLQNFSVSYTIASPDIYAAEFPCVNQANQTQPNQPSAKTTGKKKVTIHRVRSNNIGLSKLINQQQIVLVNKSRFKYMMEADSVEVKFDQQEKTVKIKNPDQASKALLKKYAKNNELEAENIHRYELWKNTKTVRQMDEEDGRGWTRQKKGGEVEDENLVYPCPFNDCNFTSKNKFVGIRIHLVKHFAKEIR
jgi:hypothetical protein